MTHGHDHGPHHGEVPYPPPPPVPARRRVFAFDMDGVIYRGAELIDGAAEAVAALRYLGLPVFYMTNNSRETPVELAAKLQRLGIDAGPEQVVSGVVSTVEYLRALDPSPELVLVMGGHGLAAQIDGAGFRLASWDGSDAPDVVVVGVDFELSYARLARATRAILLDGARYIAVNTDPQYPAADGPVPGAGAITAAVTAVTGVEPTVVGKPSPHMFRAILARSEAPADDLVVIGDMLEADVAGAKSVGATSVLVLTGTASRAEADPESMRPDFVIESLRQLPYDELLGPPSPETSAHGVS